MTNNTTDASFKKTHQTVTPNAVSRGGRRAGRRAVGRPKAVLPYSLTVPQIADEFVKHPPNNLGLANPEEQSKANDLVGSQNTEPINDQPQSEEERKRVQELADQLSGPRH